MKVNSVIVEPGNLDDLLSKVKANQDNIFLANENSFVDLDRIYNDGDKVGPQAVNLDNMTGNKEVLDALKYIMSQKQGIYFPGTLIEDVGDYYLTTMPVICNGELIGRRRKLTNLPKVDDYDILADRLLDKEDAEKIRYFDGLFSEEPMATLQKKLKEESEKRKRDTLNSFDYGGITIFPVLCHEFFSALQGYQGKKINLILHSCSNLHRDENERIPFYEKGIGKILDKEIINDPLYISIAEIGKTPSVETYEFSKGKVKEIDTDINYKTHNAV